MILVYVSWVGSVPQKSNTTPHSEIYVIYVYDLYGLHDLHDLYGLYGLYDLCRLYDLCDRYDRYGLCYLYGLYFDPGTNYTVVPRGVADLYP